MRRINGFEDHRRPVALRIYDLTNGNVAKWAPFLMWKPIEGIWHTAIYVFGYEWFWGAYINRIPPEEVERHFQMPPVKVIELGHTTKTEAELRRFLLSVCQEFTPETYDIEHRNCNNFSDKVCKFLLQGNGIPQEILDLPHQVSQSWVGKIVMMVIRKRLKARNPVQQVEDPPKSQSEEEDRRRQHSKKRFLTLPDSRELLSPLSSVRLSFNLVHSSSRSAGGVPLSDCSMAPTAKESTAMESTKSDTSCCTCSQCCPGRASVPLPTLPRRQSVQPRRKAPATTYPPPPPPETQTVLPPFPLVPRRSIVTPLDPSPLAPTHMCYYIHQPDQPQSLHPL